MIRLYKLKKPKILEEKGDLWLDELQDALKEGDGKIIASRKSRYNHSDIKSVLISETHGKCAYCEADVQAVSHGDIEHVFPKSLDISKTFEWENLGFSCQICNQNKSDKDPHLNSILDPYSKDPDPFITFFGAFINSKGTPEGRKTISYLKLDRAQLFERRQQVFKNLIKNFELICTSNDMAERSVLIEDFEKNELRTDLEFTSMRRAFWQAYKSIVMPDVEAL